MIKIIYYLLILALLSGCVSYTNLLTKEIKPNCPTTISGCFHYRLKPDNKDTVMLLKGFLTDVLVHGKFIEKTSDGILFDPSPNNNYNPPQNLYEYEDIKYVLGSNGKLIYGSFPDTAKLVPIFNLYMQNVADTFPGAENFRMSFKANEPFSFCIEPGKYVLKSINMNVINQQSSGLNEITFDVSDSLDNYIGDIYIDSLMEGDGRFIKFYNNVPSKKGRGKRGGIRKKDFVKIPAGLTFQPWYSEGHTGEHLFIIKDEMKVQSGRRKGLLNIGK